MMIKYHIKKILILIIPLTMISCNNFLSGCSLPITETVDFKILTWNTFWPGCWMSEHSHPNPTADTVKDLLELMDKRNNFDVICLQELFVGEARTKIINHMLYNIENPFKYSYGPFGGSSGIEDSGLVILSRHPIIDPQTKVFDNYCGYSGEPLVDKGVMKLTIFLEDYCFYIDVYTTHFGAQDYFSCFTARENQAKEVNSFIKNNISTSTDYPIFIVGDFNSYSTTHSSHYNTIMNNISRDISDRILLDLWTINGEANPEIRTDPNLPSYGVTNSDDNERHDHIFLLHKFNAVKLYSNIEEKYVESSLTFTQKTLLGVDYIYTVGGAYALDLPLHEYGFSTVQCDSLIVGVDDCNESDHTPLYTNITFEIRQDTEDSVTTP